jgi:hopanoid biosynthesis associated protein HpnK
MVGAPAAADAVARAKRLPKLGVGLHLVLVDGRPVLPPEQVPALVDASGNFRDNMARAGLGFFLSPSRRRQLGAEIDAQFRAFKATGLPLDHVNAHKHFQLHPTIAALILKIGQRYGLAAMRVPFEPWRVIAMFEPNSGRLAGSFLAPWTALLRRRVRRRGLAATDRMLGLAWSGAMTPTRLQGLLAHLPEGSTEIYLHPATDGNFAGAAKGYRYRDELAALIDPAVKSAAERSGARLCGFADLLPVRPNPASGDGAIAIAPGGRAPSSR